MGLPDNSKWIAQLNQLGIDVDESNFRMVNDSQFVHWSFVKQGMAIGAMPVFAVSDDKSVERVLESLPGFPIKTWVVSHKELRTSRRIKFVYDNLVEHLNHL